jgi:hypothetical protein
MAKNLKLPDLDDPNSPYNPEDITGLGKHYPAAMNYPNKFYPLTYERT